MPKQLNPAYVFNFSLFNKLRNLEVAVLMLVALLEAMVTPLTSTYTLQPNLLLSLYLMAIVAILAYFPPLNAALWQRLIYLLFEISLVFVASILGVYRLFPLLFIVIAAKGALMLSLRGLIAILIFTSLIHAIGSELQPSLTNEHLPAAPQTVSLPYLLVIRSESEIFMIVALVLVAIMARTLISEQQSRQQVEKLAKEVEALAVYQERARIAREIHDALGHTLTSLNIQLDVARKLDEKDSTISKSALNSAKQLARQSLNDVRNALQMIVPPNDQADFDLNQALLALVQQIEESQSMKVMLDLEPVKLPFAKSHHLYCIIRECLTNIQRHASANSASIALRHVDDGIVATVTDNGCGYDMQAPSTGFGISGMKERTKQLGGKLSIQSTPGAGTNVQVHVPT